MTEHEIKSLVDQAQIDSDLTALTAATDRHAPEELLALVGQKGYGWEITAITAGESTRWVPDGHIARDAKLQWSMYMLRGKTVTPPAIKRTEHGVYARVMGNAVIVEGWLRERGYHQAFAGSPHAVWVGDLCAGRMRLKAGNYHECDGCGYIPME